MPVRVDQVQHLAPVNGVLFLYHLCGILDRFFHQPHLFDPVTDQTKLDIQRIQHEMIIGITDGHFHGCHPGKSPGISEGGSAEALQNPRLYKKRAPDSVTRGFQDILFIIIADSTQSYMCHACKFAGRIVAVFFS